MARIARVKFSGDEKTYDYLCPDKSLEEGDVVYLEGKENPSFIYEIKEVTDKDCDATKKVLSKAIENKDVTLSSKYMDITAATQECIVNSLGTHIQELGNICYAIYHASKSKELEDYIKSNTKGTVFDIKVTSAGLLPSKHIINIVMPYKYQDENNDLLRKAFTLVIDKAIELKYKSIAIPYIGTGANGYKYEDIHEALNDVMFNYQYRQGIAIDITSVRYYGKYKQRDEDYYGREYPRNERNRNLNLPYQNNKKELVLESWNTIENYKLIHSEIRKHYNPNDELKLEVLDTPADFIRKAIKQAGGFTKVPDIRYVLNNDAIKNINNYKKTIRKEEIYRSSVILHLNFTQIVQYMEICGYTFSPTTDNHLDLAIFNYIVNNNGFVKPEYEIYEYFQNCKKEVEKVIIEYEPPRKPKKKKAAVAVASA